MLSEKSLNSYWNFATDAGERGLGLGWNRTVPECVQEILVPSCWNEWKEEMREYDGVAWYFREFHILKDPNIHRHTLLFYGVNYRCEVWVNGISAGGHVGGFAPFEIDISRLVKFDTANLVVIRVDSRLNASSVPPIGVDWYNYGGVYRDVILGGYGTGFFEDITVRTKMSGEIGIALETGGYDSMAENTVDICVCESRSGISVFEKSFQLNSKSDGLSFRLNNPKLWSLEKPQLYDFTLTLMTNGKESDIWRHKIGVREISVKDRRIFINNEPVILRGYSKHEEYPMYARSFVKEIVQKDYDLMRQGGCNFVRMVHYPHHPMEYDIASETGFAVIAETPNVNFTAAFFADGEVRKNSLNQLYELIRHYKNHACILFWSLFIECAADSDEAVKFISECINTVKTVDPSRLTIHASNRPREDRCLGFFDVMGINYWNGWYNGETLDEGSALLDELASLFPEKPIIITSGGWEGMPGLHAYRGELKWSEESQANYLDGLTRMYQSKDYIAGQISWTFNDFRVMPWIDPGKKWPCGWWTQRPAEMNFKGVLDYYRRPKLAYYRMQEAFNRWKDVFKK